MTAVSQQTILIADDNKDALYALERILAHNGYLVVCAFSGEEAYEKALSCDPSLILLDVVMPRGDGYQVTRNLKAHPELRYVPIVLLSAKDTLEDIIVGLDNGADDYISKPFKPEELLARLRAALRLKTLYKNLGSSERQNEQLKKQLCREYDFQNIVGESPAMQEVFSLVKKVSLVDSPVLITGPTGSGKELIAHAIHYNSARQGGPLVVQNCAAFNDNLLESELFGHVRGSFTGAIRDRKGLFEVAHGGTLFLDEVGEMSQALQAKLLRVLQDGKFLAVGGSLPVKVDVRLLAATNRDLGKMVREELFREDLYYRLNVVQIKLPALAERREDIPLLINSFLHRLRAKYPQRQKAITKRAVEILSCYSWPGNVRELENEIERMLILGVDSEEVDMDVISERILDRTADLEVREETGKGVLKVALEKLERELILESLRRARGNKSLAAKELGISRSNLITKVKLYGLSNEQ
ncbi:MAG: sigma-54-dependent Fis family transcriptional regulator [Deltaproteobacteria bacterium]|nr:sigma-54-dependent Fis family transcriptional regulator [Deltaproteobacteria bacterium]